MPDFVKIQNTLEHIESNQKHWNQAHWNGSNECGTTHCMAGWAMSIYDGRTDSYDPEGRGAEILGLNDEQRNRLFYFTMVSKGECSPLCASGFSFLSHAGYCDSDADHNQHPTFEQYVEHVEKHVPGFVYDWSKNAKA